MEKSYEELVAEAKLADVEAVHEALSSGEHITIVDVREPDEYAGEHIPRGTLETQAAEQIQERTHRHPLRCRRSGLACRQEPRGDGLHELRQPGRRLERLEG